MSENEKYPKKITMEGYPSTTDIGLFMLDKLDISSRRHIRMEGRGIPLSNQMDCPKYRLTLTRLDPPKKKGRV